MQRLTNSMVIQVRNSLLVAQKGLCAICAIDIKKELKTPTLDHDHETGICRGVLCNNCNGLEGKVKNIANRAKRGGTSLEWLKNLIAYLEHHSKPRTTMLHPTHRTADEERLLKNKRARLKRQREAKAKAKGKA